MYHTATYPGQKLWGENECTECWCHPNPHWSGSHGNVPNWVTELKTTTALSSHAAIKSPHLDSKCNWPLNQYLCFGNAKPFYGRWTVLSLFIFAMGRRINSRISILKGKQREQQRDKLDWKLYTENVPVFFFSSYLLGICVPQVTAMLIHSLSKKARERVGLWGCHSSWPCSYCHWYKLPNTK